MNKLNIKIINNKKNITEESINIKIESELNIIINIYKLDNYDLFLLITKIENIINVYEKIFNININFDLNITKIECDKILSKLNNIFYKFYQNTKKIKLYNVSNDSVKLMNELF